MSRLVRLYPQAWRDRYGDEFTALLEERPPTTGDVIDTLRGALDAHLHPTVGASEPAPWTHRLPGLLALTAGLALSSVILLIALRLDPTFDAGLIVTIFMFAAVICLPGDYMAAHGRGIGLGIGACLLSYVLAHVAGWNPVGLGFTVLVFLLAACGPLVLAAVRAGIGPRRRWLLLGGAVFLPLVTGVAISVLRDVTGIALIPRESPAMFFLVLPYGLAWAVVGLRMTIRGAPTLVDPPPRVHAPEPEVRPA